MRFHQGSIGFPRNQEHQQSGPLLFISIEDNDINNIDMDSKLTKAEIIENIHGKLRTDRKDIHAIINAFFDEVKEGLGKGMTAELRGFGTFEVVVRKGKEKARNPKTGEIVSVDRHGVALFRAGKELKEELWKITANR